MKYGIFELTRHEDLDDIKSFLFKMIKEEYGYGYVPCYHYDIINLEDIYLNPKRNNFFYAKSLDNDRIIGTIAVRKLDKSFSELDEIYPRPDLASLWRVFVDKDYRRRGIASSLVKISEEFAMANGYSDMYLHTHKNVPGALDFWTNQKYGIILDTNNELQTVHMVKKINGGTLNFMNSK